VLIVAEKFQTGSTSLVAHHVRRQGADWTQRGSDSFAPEPHDGGKTDTFVLDFRNDTTTSRRRSRRGSNDEAIPTDPNLLWDTHRTFMDSR